jgi:hypothetical protein
MQRLRTCACHAVVSCHVLRCYVSCFVLMCCHAVSLLLLLLLYPQVLGGGTSQCVYPPAPGSCGSTHTGTQPRQVQPQGDPGPHAHICWWWVGAGRACDRKVVHVHVQLLDRVQRVGRSFRAASQAVTNSSGIWLLLLLLPLRLWQQCERQLFQMEVKALLSEPLPCCVVCLKGYAVTALQSLQNLYEVYVSSFAPCTTCAVCLRCLLAAGAGGARLQEVGHGSVPGCCTGL